VFTRAGTAGARMQDIAREAGVNQALLHYYFRTKEALGERVFFDAASALFAAMPRDLRPDSPLADIVHSFVASYIDTVRKTPFIPGYVAAETHQHPERIAALLTRVTGRNPTTDTPLLLQMVQQMIDARVAAGEMRAIKAEQLLVNMMALVTFPFIAQRVLTGVYGMDDAQFERFLDERRQELPKFILNALRV
jgi:AcrR family transcriptional regulator